MTIKLGSSVSLREFAAAIKAVGDKVTIIGQGEPGIGKSAVLKYLANDMPGYSVAYIDCTLLDLGDFAIPYVMDENGVKVTRFAPNARFKFQEKRPVIIMLDEIGKAMKSVKNVLLTLMLEHRNGDSHLPEGSIVFGTTNLATDGVGDMLEAHARNRTCFVTVRKPGAGFGEDGSVAQDSWGAWALANGIDPVIIAAIRQFPHWLDSYTDGASAKDNPYIFNPTRAGQTAFVSPRSLEKASDIVKKREVLGESLTLALLCGELGEVAARDTSALISVADKLPTRESIITSPKTAKMPNDIVAKCMLVFGALSWVDKKTLPAWIEYSQRMEKELQAMFARSAMNIPSKQAICVMDKSFRDWALQNEWMF